MTWLITVGQANEVVNWIGALASPTVTFIVAFLAAFLGYLFSKRAEEQKHRRTLQSQAYADFIRAVAGMATTKQQLVTNSHKVESEQRKEMYNRLNEGLASLADAKARIVIYGTKPVVEALADFFHHGATLDNEASYQRFVRAIQSMRLDSWGKSELIRDSDVVRLLLGEDIIQVTTN